MQAADKCLVQSDLPVGFDRSIGVMRPDVGIMPQDLLQATTCYPDSVSVEHSMAAGKMKSKSSKWTPRTVEDLMLEAYWRSQGGMLFREVPIGGPGGNGKWPEHCTVRRIDGVLLKGSVDSTTYRFNAITADLLKESIKSLSVELIEAKSVLKRAVIGQAIVARRMFVRHYGKTKVRVTILCGVGDSALEWVCQEEDVQVVIMRDVQKTPDNKALQPDERRASFAAERQVKSRAARG